MTQNFTINTNHRSEAFDERIKFLILHYTERNLKTSLELLNKDVSAHYLISDNPVEIFNLVDEDKRAWHSGVSYWRGINNLNESSIGIEIVNLNGNKHQYPHKQIEAVIFLCKQIIDRYKIAPWCVLGHSDIAPLRKKDPGALFPWRKLYENGIGLMVSEEEVEKLIKTTFIPTATELQHSLTRYGYKIKITHIFDEQTKTVLDSFRRHFCPDLIGQPIDKKSYATLMALIGKCSK
jgi:N-acetylmuramoyl-L-alanine amidase